MRDVQSHYHDEHVDYYVNLALVHLADAKAHKRPDKVALALTNMYSYTVAIPDAIEVAEQRKAGK